MSAPTSYAYQWLRDGLPIAGAASNAYTLVAADIGAIIGVRVTAINSAGSNSVTVQETSVVQDLGSVSSAGVFDSSDRLVRTLWSAQTNDPRVTDPAAAWDGTLDDLSVAPTGTYTIKVLYNACTYAWDGVVGNSTPDHPSVPIHYLSGTTVVWSMCITDDGNRFYTNSYHEKNATVYFQLPTDDVNYTWPPQYYPNYGVFGAQYGDPNGYAYYMWGAIGTGWNHFSCTDGTNVYFSHSLDHPTFIIGVNGTTKAQIQYASSNAGISWTIGIYDDSGGVGVPFDWISGVAAQKVGNCIFVARPAAGTGQLWVLDKATGATIRKDTSLPYCYALGASTTASELWVSFKDVGHADLDTIAKIAVDPGGNFTDTGVRISGPVVITQMAVSPNGARLLLLDQTTQQVKAYNTIDGTLDTTWGNSGTLGQSGGYATSPTVTDDKFMFNTIAGGMGGSPGGWVCYAPDGSFWIGDNGNYRHLHFSSGNSPTLIEKTCYVPTVYSVDLCRNDDTRLFGNFLEWEIDYSKATMTPTNGAWTLKNNWTYGLSGSLGQFNDNFNALKFVGVYNNGRTYAGVYTNDGVNIRRRIYELTSTGLRYTGVEIDTSNNIDSDFNIWNWDDLSPPRLWLNPFLGFDVNGNPSWAGNVLDWHIVGPDANWVLVMTFGSYPSSFPTLSDVLRVIDPLENGTLPLFLPPGDRQKDHFAGVDLATSDLKFSTHSETTTLPRGGVGYEHQFFAEAPYFEDSGGGSSGNYGGGLIYRSGRPDCFTGWRGELWTGGQGNMYSHWHQSGLLINRFGTLAPYFAAASVNAGEYWDDPYRLVPAADSAWYGLPGRAGNNSRGGLAYQNGKYYLYHGEEWVHSGVHRWTIDNLGSVSFGAVAVVEWDSAGYVPPTPDPTDMLAGLPYNSTDLPNNSAGWVRNPTANDGTLYRVWTNVIRTDPRASPDLYYVVRTPALPYTAQLKKQVPRTGTGNWSMVITPCIGPQGGSVYQAVPLVRGGMYLEITDSAGKVILSMSPLGFYIGGSPYSTLCVNDTDYTGPAFAGVPFYYYSTGGYWPDPIYDGSQYTKLRDIVISADVNANTLTVTYTSPDTVMGTPFGYHASLTVTPYDPTADITDPFEFQVNLRSDNNVNALDPSITFYKMHFYG